MVAASSPLTVQPAAGRFLLLSPEWSGEEASVLFDRNSGDYWVVTRPARALIDRLVGAGRPVRMDELGQDADHPGASDTSRLVEELSALGILTIG